MKVQLKQSYAKWLLDHPEIYYSSVTWDDNYEEEAMVCLTCCLGEKVYGSVKGEGSFPNTYLVHFKVGSFKLNTYVEVPRHAVFVK